MNAGLLLRIGLSASIFPPDPQRPTFKGKRLLYSEESMCHWVMRSGAMPLQLPTSASDGLGAEEVIASVDGLLLTGGSDIAPQSYNEKPLQSRWAGDPVRDAYELDLVRAAIGARVPVLGVCRGIELINVALGGTLYQDIATQLPDALVHRDADRYDQNVHSVRVEPDSGLARLCPGENVVKVNSVHHQAIKVLAEGLVCEARSVPDDIIEAVRLKHSGANCPYLFGVQWHPEFQDPRDTNLLSPKLIMDEFLGEAAQLRSKRTSAC